MRTIVFSAVAVIVVWLTGCQTAAKVSVLDSRSRPVSGAVCFASNPSMVAKGGKGVAVSDARGIATFEVGRNFFGAIDSEMLYCVVKKGFWPTRTYRTSIVRLYPIGTKTVASLDRKSVV